MQIDVHNLNYSYGSKNILSNLSLSLSDGDYLVVQGKNGVGKSTFIKCLLGFNAVKSGSIFYDHQDINNFKGWTKFGYVSQKFEDFNYEFPITVKEFLSISSLRKTSEKTRLRVLDQLGILELINQNINNLSGGELQRTFIARSMLNDPQVLILDEPTASIDKLSVEYFYQAVNHLNERGVTIVLVTHNDSIDHLNYSHVLTLNSDMTYVFHKRERTEATL